MMTTDTRIPLVSASGSTRMVEKSSKSPTVTLGSEEKVAALKYLGQAYPNLDEGQLLQKYAKRKHSIETGKE